MGIPFSDNSFDAVYHSHVLEHFNKIDGENLIKECFRVLKPGGVLRVAVPDLEQIAIKYLFFLNEGVKDPNNQFINKSYEWMKLEMYDQMVRNQSGGEILHYLSQDYINNESFVFERIGYEGIEIRDFILKNKKDNTIRKNPKNLILNKLIIIKNLVKSFIYKILNIDIKSLEIGRFRMSGEIHQWMYDRYSLHDLLFKNGGDKIVTQKSNESYIQNWDKYNLDYNLGVTRKPDSLFMECIKK
jgi:hypothetical protein